MERAQLIRLLQQTGCAIVRGEAWFLTDPAWPESDRARAEQLMATLPTGPADRGWLGLPTGGSSGGIRFARHDEGTLATAAHGFAGHFGFSRVNAVDVLPPYHVSGLMARVRCCVTGGRHIAWDWRRLVGGDRPPLEGRAEWVISLVPTQLQRLLADSAALAWLREFRAVLVGGGPMWGEVAERAAEARLPIALSYGMTETAAMVTALCPDEFLQGRRDSGRALPHAALRTDADGVIEVTGGSVFHGYWPAWTDTRSYRTEDLGEIDGAGYLRVVGRRDAMIISGGKKVQPSEVEAALRATGEFEDVAVLGVRDAAWGEAVVACYAAEGRAPDWAAVTRAMEHTLAPYKRPKRFVPVRPWPRNAQGKINRARLRALAEQGSPRQSPDLSA